MNRGKYGRKKKKKKNIKRAKVLCLKLADQQYTAGQQMGIQ